MEKLGKKEIKYNWYHFYIRYKKYIFLSLIFCLATFASFLLFAVDISGQGLFNDSLTNLNSINIYLSLIIASICMSFASYLLQMTTKNRLADTSILGIGNINLIVLQIILATINIMFPSTDPIMFLFFILGSTLITFLIFFLTFKKRGKISNKFILAGIILNFTLIAISASLNSLFSNAIFLGRVNEYIEGFNSKVPWNTIYIGVSLLVFITIWFSIISKKYKICIVDENISNSVGIKTNLIYFQVMIIIGFLSGIAYVFVGNITFLGLISGNIGYAIFRKKVFLSILTSALFAIFVFTFAYFIFNNILFVLSTRPNVSVMIIIVSAPYFIYIIWRSK